MIRLLPIHPILHLPKLMRRRHRSGLGHALGIPACAHWFAHSSFCSRASQYGVLRASSGRKYHIPFSKSPHRFIVILLESNSPSYSIPAFFVFSPAVFRVSPQLKSSNFQYA